jgi:hypothetical protein
MCSVTHRHYQCVALWRSLPWGNYYCSKTIRLISVLIFHSSRLKQYAARLIRTTNNHTPKVQEYFMRFQLCLVFSVTFIVQSIHCILPFTLQTAWHATSKIVNQVLTRNFCVLFNYYNFPNTHLIDKLKISFHPKSFVAYPFFFF